MVQTTSSQNLGGIGVGIGVEIGVRIGIGVGIGVGMGIGVRIGIGVGIGIRVGVGVGVGIGPWETIKNLMFCTCMYITELKKLKQYIQGVSKTHAFIS